MNCHPDRSDPNGARSGGTCCFRLPATKPRVGLSFRAKPRNRPFSPRNHAPQHEQPSVEITSRRRGICTPSTGNQPQQKQPLSPLSFRAKPRNRPFSPGNHAPQHEQASVELTSAGEGSALPPPATNLNKSNPSPPCHSERSRGIALSLPATTLHSMNSPPLKSRAAGEGSALPPPATNLNRSNPCHPEHMTC